jgi:hypothetical protein
VESAHQEKLRLLKNESDPAFTIALDIESTSFSGEDLEAGLGGHEQTETRPLTSPPSEISPTTSSSTTTPASEKARGKMKARRSLSSDTIGDRMAAAGVGRNGFLPTQEWVSVSSHYRTLPVAHLHESRLRLGNKGQCLLAVVRVSPKC